MAGSRQSFFPSGKDVPVVEAIAVHAGVAANKEQLQDEAPN
jgi:hypothetical protein